MKPPVPTLLRLRLRRTNCGRSIGTPISGESSFEDRTVNGERDRIIGWATIITSKSEGITGSFGTFTGLAGGFTDSAAIYSTDRRVFTGDPAEMTLFFDAIRRGLAALTCEGRVITFPAESLSGDTGRYTSSADTFTVSSGFADKGSLLQRPVFSIETGLRG